jgi:hypothetical protein
MGVFVDTGGKSVEFRNFCFDEESSTFKSEVDVNTGLSLSVRAPIVIDNAFEDKEFFVFLFSKANLVESEIFQVVDKTKNRRVGWCIPVNALNSNEHSHASNVHFWRYAYVAIKFILNSQSAINTKLRFFGDEAPVHIYELLPESTTIFVVSKETLDCDFEISRWIPALAALGYFQLTSIAPENIRVLRDRVQTPRLEVVPVSPEISELEQLTAIYSHAYPFEGNPLFQFFYLYQIVEHLMELVFKNEQASLVQRIISCQQDVNATKDLLDGAHKNTSEKQRIKLLVGTYCCCDGGLSEVIGVCNELLRQLGRDEGTTLDTTLYPIRNFLFHQFRNFPSSATEPLERVIVSLSSLLPTLLGNFKNSPVEELGIPLAQVEA